MSAYNAYVKIALGSIFYMIASGLGHTQEPALPPISQDGVNHYCIFNSRIYSVGSILCVPQAKVTLLCVSTAEDQNKSATGHAVWRTKTADAQCK
jgi:hypothetical protein